MVAGGALGAPLDLSVDGAVDTLPPMPNAIAVIPPLEEGAPRSANKGLLVVKDGWFTYKGFNGSWLVLMLPAAGTCVLPMGMED